MTKYLWQSCQADPRRIGVRLELGTRFLGEVTELPKSEKEMGVINSNR